MLTALRLNDGRGGDGRMEMADRAWVLASTDFSAGADLAVRRAAGLAARRGLGLRLLHVQSAGQLQGWRALFDAVPAGMPTPEQVAESKLQLLTAALVAEFGIAVDARCERGEPDERILAQLADEACALGVMGAAGEHALRQLFFGSTSWRVAARHHGQLLVARLAPSEPYRRIVIATDFSASAQAALEQALVFAPEAECYLLHAYEVPFELGMRVHGVDAATIGHYRRAARERADRAMQACLAELGDMRPRLTPITLHGHAPARIVDFARQCEADLVVMGAAWQGALQQMLPGSVSQHVLQECDRDMLIVRT